MRELNLQEEKLLEELISRSNIKIPSNWKNDLLVSPLHDGKMGSLTLFPHNTLNKERHFGVQVSECQFKGYYWHSINIFKLAFANLKILMECQ